MGLRTLQPSPLSRCTLCPRACGVDRLNGGRGFCGSGGVARVYRYGPHFGEEPPLTGGKGAGTIFFSHCTLRCLYCQNYKWSQGNEGEDVGVERLAEMMRELAGKGCHNIDLVSPTPWLPMVRAARKIAFGDDNRLPFVYNTSGYESPDTLGEFSDTFDIALTDLRYSRPATALAASAAGDYVDVARKALLWFCTHLGPLETDDDGIAVRGVICRLLVLPGHADEAVDNLRWIADNIGPELHVSLMSQYTPVYKATGNGDWGRKVAEAEYRLVTDEAERLGFEDGWIQPFEAEEDKTLLGCEMSAGEGTVGRGNR